jgi:hypothetical protein
MVHQQGGLVLHRTMPENGGSEAEGLIAVAHSYAEACSAAALRMQLGQHASMLLAHLPEVREKITTVNNAELVDLGDREYIPAADALVTAIAATAPVLLVVDDVNSLTDWEVVVLESMVDPTKSDPLLVVLISANPGDTTTRLASVLRKGATLVSVAERAVSDAAAGDGAELTTTFSGTSVPLATVVLPDSTRVALDPKGSMIGRHPTCAIVLDDTDVSRRHALIRAVGPNWVITDNGSTNGTRVNGETVRDQVLVDGDEIVVGSTLIHFAAG